MSEIDFKRKPKLKTLRGLGFSLRTLRKAHNKLEAENKILLKEKCLDEILESYTKYNDRLQAENKALNNALEQNKIVAELLLEDYKALKQSRDELLGALKLAKEKRLQFDTQEFKNLIQRTQALKDKE